MLAIRRKRFLLDVEAKIIVSPVNRLKFLVVRYPRDTGGFSYHYFSLRADDQLYKQKTRPAIRKFLNLPHLTEGEANRFYDAIWDGTVSLKAVKELRAKTSQRAQPN
jgi:hypothetical protein